MAQAIGNRGIYPCGGGDRVERNAIGASRIGRGRDRAARFPPSENWYPGACACCDFRRSFYSALVLTSGIETESASPLVRGGSARRRAPSTVEGFAADGE